MVHSVRRVSAIGAVVGVLALGAVIGTALVLPQPLRPETASTTSPSASAAVIRADPTRVVLTPTESPSTSQSFSWLAGDVSHTSGSVQIRMTTDGVRTVGARAVGTVNGNPLVHFSATVTDLRPATTYRYRVGLEGSWSGWREFTTPTLDAHFQFIYFGDAQYGLDSTWRSVVQQAEAQAPAAIGSVHAGDLIDGPTEESQWIDWFAGMGEAASTRNVMAAPGNHEYIGDPWLRAWKANFEYPRNNPAIATSGSLADLAVGESDIALQYSAYFRHWEQFAAETVYYTDYEDVRFITLNGTQDVGFLTPANLPPCEDERCPSHRVGELWVQFQAAWLDRVLAQSPSKWNIVTFHQPVYSASVGRDEPILRGYWVPVFERHNVDLVLMGHDHVYARGYNDDDVTAIDGVTDGPVYVVSNSGAKYYELTSPEDNVWTRNGATQVRRGGGVTTYQVIDVSADRLVYRSYLAEKAPETTTSRDVGDIYDEFTITKTDDRRKWVTEAGIDPPRTSD